MCEEINKLMFNNFFIQIEEFTHKNQEQHYREVKKSSRDEEEVVSADCRECKE
jgi:hypothetical protein